MLRGDKKWQMCCQAKQQSGSSDFIPKISEDLRAAMAPAKMRDFERNKIFGNLEKSLNKFI